MLSARALTIDIALHFPRMQRPTGLYMLTACYLLPVPKHDRVLFALAAVQLDQSVGPVSWTRAFVVITYYVPSGLVQTPGKP